MELIVTRKDDLVVQYQANNQEILQAKDEMEKRLQGEIKQAMSSVEQWKKKSFHSDALATEVVQLKKEKAFLIQQHANEMDAAKSDNPISKQDPATVANLENNVRTLAEANVRLQNQVALEQGQKIQLQEALWYQELNSPPSFSLFRSYELQRDAFLKMSNLNQGTILTDEEFDRAWSGAEKYSNMHNLICEMIARGELYLTSPTKLLALIGDIGTRVFLYYAHLELQVGEKRKKDFAAEPHRYVRISEHKVTLSTITCPVPELFAQWAPTLEVLNEELQEETSFENTLLQLIAREDVAQRGEMSIGHYIYNKVRAHQRIQRSKEGINRQVIETEDIRVQVHLPQPPDSFRVPTSMTVTAPVTGSFLKRKFLGNYDHMFESKEEIPFPTWRAIEWILEDCGLSQKAWRQWDKLYPRISLSWTVAPPVVVAQHPHFCPLRGTRRYKWAPWARIDTIPYNWPIIPGHFNTWQECAEAYGTFFEAHRLHFDSVCFRAAIFSKVLSYLCIMFKLTITMAEMRQT